MQFWVLESPAQFSTHCIVIGSTVRLRILGLGIVIERTVCEKCCCYLQHSLPGQAAGFLQNLLLSSAQFGKIHGLFRVVIGGTFLLPGQNHGCYVRHISKNSAGFSPVVICSTFSGWGLLFSAQFTVCIISFFAATGVVIHGTFCKKSLFSVPFPLLFTAQFPQKFLLGLLFSAQFRKNSAFAGQIVSLDTISRIFAGCCYSQHNLIFCKISDFSAPVVIRSTIPAKIFFGFLGVGIERTI